MEESLSYLDYVQQQLRKRILEIDDSLEEGQKEIEGMNSYYWENYTEMDEYGYENYDNQQALLGQVQANSELLKEKFRYKRMLDSTFFGRVRFWYDDEEEEETFYIGLGNFSKENGSLPLVYDWRAPVSSLFYNYDKGEASYTAPMGEISGEILSKWQYRIRRGRMVYGFESDIKINDDILGQELGKNGETKLKNIVATIQKEQNAIIRNTKDRIMVIQGVAGSGKTSIALHRIAYLLYAEREYLKSSNVLILSPNAVFSDYISHILPELGEENIREMSFDSFAYWELQGIVGDCENRYDQIEKIIANPELESDSRYKESEEFLNQMEEYMLTLEDSLMTFKTVRHGGQECTQRDIEKWFYDRYAGVPLLSRMDAIAEYFIDEIETLRDRDMEQDERDAVMQKFRKMYGTRDLYILYNKFLAREELKTLKHCHLEERKLPYEDVYPLLYMKYRMMSHPSRQDIRHLIVDEMQDYSQIQYRILQMIFTCRMTILGDKAQSLDDQTVDVLSFLPKLYGKKIRTIVMNKSYRNTVEIAEYANRVKGITDMEIFERHGKPVEETETEGFEDAMEAVLERVRLESEKDLSGYETAAVIVQTKAEAKRAYAYIRERLEKEGFDIRNRLSILHNGETKFTRGLTISTYYMAKGLEFDQVFGVFGEGGSRELLRQAKYIAATRALHELYMITVKE